MLIYNQYHISKLRKTKVITLNVSKQIPIHTEAPLTHFKSHKKVSDKTDLPGMKKTSP